MVAYALVQRVRLSFSLQVWMEFVSPNLISNVSTDLRVI